MPWFRVDDTIHSHPKARRAGLAAMGLWMFSGSYSASYLKDGFLTASEVRLLGGHNYLRLARQLCDAELWYPDERNGEKGWSFHDWDQYQPTRAQVEHERKQARVRQKSRRDSRRDTAVTTPVTTPVSHAAPTRPSPSGAGLGSNSSKTNAPARLEDRARAGATSAPGARAVPTGEIPKWILDIADCELCDDNGMKLPDSAFQCDHIDRRETNAKGMAAVRQALAETKSAKANRQ